MTIWEAAIRVLRKENSPMFIRDIYDKIILMNLYEFKAQKPIQVLNGEIRRRCKNIAFNTASKNKYFLRLQNGSYSLLSQNQDDKLEYTGLIKEENELVLLEEKLEKNYQRYRESFKKVVLEELKNLTPYEFECFSRNFLTSYGFSKVHVTSKSRDGGIDGVGLLRIGLGQLNVAFQCKRWTKACVGRREIDQFRGAISGLYYQGIFFTTSTFSKEAISASFRQGAVPIILVDGDSLVETMLDKGIGISVKNLPKYSVALDEVISIEN